MQSIKMVTFIRRIYANCQITNTYCRINIRPYICEGLLFEDHIIEVSVKNTYFSDPDAVRCKISKNEIHLTLR